MNVATLLPRYSMWGEIATSIPSPSLVRSSSPPSPDSHGCCPARSHAPDSRCVLAAILTYINYTSPQHKLVRRILRRDEREKQLYETNGSAHDGACGETQRLDILRFRRSPPLSALALACKRSSRHFSNRTPFDAATPPRKMRDYPGMGLKAK